MGTAFIENMSWEAFRDAVSEDPVVVVPMGSTELEGPHLPLGTDTIVADGVARRLDGGPGVLIGPTLPIGYSKWFLPYPGTITLETETLIQVLVEYIGSLIIGGVKRFVFLNAHKGNNAAIESASRRILEHHKVRMGMLSIWKLAHDLCAVKDQMAEEGRFTHSGELMTSAVMALEPESVVENRIRADTVKPLENSLLNLKNSLGETEFMGSVQIVFQKIQDVTDSGTLGDPTAATAEKGEAVIKRIVEYAQAFLVEFRKLPLD
ncbi:MAG TPA: creatininase family protein [Desulfobacteraceae bacterium]|nr:creatininase family protein [Desulfobacteraceae bacterium]